MASHNFPYYGRLALIVMEVLLISLFAYYVEHYHPIEMARYVSLDVLYCLPILQTAHLTAIHTTRRNDTQTSNIVGVVVALIWSTTEVAITWPHFPIAAFLLNTFTRSVAFIVIGRVVIKLWREREYAHKDMLTDLANRVELLERLESEQRRSERNHSPYSLLFIDIDSFKSLNNAQGNKIGDIALQVLAEILRECIRKVDVAARLGGDKFSLLLPDTDKKTCYILIKRIEASSKRAFKERSLPISVSIGQTTHVGQSQSPKAIIKLAEENMYETRQLKQQMMNAATSQ